MVSVANDMIAPRAADESPPPSSKSLATTPSSSAATLRLVFVVFAAAVLIVVLLGQGTPPASRRTPQVNAEESSDSTVAATFPAVLPTNDASTALAATTPAPTTTTTAPAAAAAAAAGTERTGAPPSASSSSDDFGGNWSTGPRPTTDADYQTSVFDTAFPPAQARVRPAQSAHVAKLVKPDAPPVDAVLLFPFGSADWEKDYLPRDVLPNAVNGGHFAVKAINVEKWTGGNPSPSADDLTWGALFGGGRSRGEGAEQSPANSSALDNDNTAEASAATPVDPKRRVPVIWAAHLSDGFPTNCPKKVLAKLEYYRPTVILVLSDEHARTWCLHRAIESFRKTLAETGAGGGPKLVLRQYSKRSSGNLPGNDVRTMPLGYMSGMTLPPNLERDVLRRASSRRLAWSFVGNPKGARKNMVQILSGRIKPFVASAKGGFTPLHMTRVYGDSKFVLSPKGFSRLDCFRIYEASRVGAIPVIVARPTEARIAFDAFVGEKVGTLPPWIFANNWFEATKQMQRLLDNKQELDAKQDEVLQWWDRVNFNMRLQIYEALRAASSTRT